MYPLFQVMLGNLVIRPPVSIEGLGQNGVAWSGQSWPSGLGRGATVWDATEVGVGEGRSAQPGKTKRWHTPPQGPTNSMSDNPECSCQAKACATHAILAPSGKKCLSAVQRPKQNPLNKAKGEYAPCAICISPAFREAEGGLWPLKARRHPCRSVAMRLPISHRPLTLLPPARWPPSGLIPWQQNNTAAYGPSRAT